jgi:hypothetical protein
VYLKRYNETLPQEANEFSLGRFFEVQSLSIERGGWRVFLTRREIKNF